MQWDVRTFDTIDSTNRYLLDEAKSGARAGLVAAAGHQTAGRGRRGRVWDSKPGASLCVSILFRPSPDEILVRYPQAVALAITDTSALVAGFDSALKWPNDVVVSSGDGYRKLAGVLSESETIDDKLALVVGCGINLNWGGDMPATLAETAVSADELAGHALDADEFLQAFLRHLNERLGRPSWITESYRQRCITLGKRVRVEQADSNLEGFAESIADDGSLNIVTDDGEVHTVTIGDVVHLRAS